MPVCKRWELVPFKYRLDVLFTFVFVMILMESLEDLAAISPVLQE